jgi:hypothetical protein
LLFWFGRVLFPIQAENQQSAFPFPSTIYFSAMIRSNRSDSSKFSDDNSRFYRSDSPKSPDDNNRFNEKSFERQ